MFRLEFKTENDAFHEGLVWETVRILKETIRRLNQMQVDGIITDINGNPIGKFSLTTK